MAGREQFEKISTGNGFANDLSATTNDRLELTVIELQNLQDNNTQQTDKLDDRLKDLELSIEYLNQSIDIANQKNDRLQRWFLVISVISAIFAASGIIQAWDILTRGIGN